MEKRRKLKGYWILILAALICWTLLGRTASDVFLVNYGPESFQKRFLAQHSLDVTQPQTYDSEREDAIAVYALQQPGLSLKAGGYDIGFLCDGADGDTVLKIFSSDYTSPDNAGGKVLVYQMLDPAQKYATAQFELDQDVSSVYVLVETNAPDFSIGYLHMASFGSVCTDTAFYCVLTVLCALALFWVVNGRFAAVAPGALGEETVPPHRVALCCVLVGAYRSLWRPCRCCKADWPTGMICSIIWRASKASHPVLPAGNSRCGCTGRY